MKRDLKMIQWNPVQAREEFSEFARRHHDPRDLDFVELAYDFAVEAHDGQMRKNLVDPYVTHPIAVARMPAEMFRIRDRRFTAVGLLHDVLEDCPRFDERRIATMLGHDILTSVRVLTKDKLRKHAFLQQLRHEGGVMEWMLKLCDTIHNLSTIQYVPRADARRIVRNTRRDYLPLARDLVSRLPLREQWWGLHLYAEIECLCIEFERSDARRGL